MDLKIEDVSELLNVSESTIRRWIKNKQIPSYKLNREYRFSRLEIENWVLGNQANQEEQGISEVNGIKAGTKQFSLFRAVHNGDVLVDIPGRSKMEIIQNVSQVAAVKLGLDPILVTELLLDRENLMPTALNHGIAVPHPR